MVLIIIQQHSLKAWMRFIRGKLRTAISSVTDTSWTAKRRRRATSESMRRAESSEPRSLWTGKTRRGTTSPWWPRRLVGTRLSGHLWGVGVNERTRNIRWVNPKDLNDCFTIKRMNSHKSTKLSTNDGWWQLLQKFKKIFHLSPYLENVWFFYINT